MTKKATRSVPILAEYWNRFQGSLFPFLGGIVEEPLTRKLERLVVIWDAARIEEHVRSPHGQVMGRRECDRRKLARTFVAKAAYDLQSTEALIELLRTHRGLRLLCGFERARDVPSAATFSRAFAEFAESGLGVPPFDVHWEHFGPNNAIFADGKLE